MEIRQSKSSKVRTAYPFPSQAMRDADDELAEQIVHLPVKAKAGKKRHPLSQRKTLVKPECLKFS